MRELVIEKILEEDESYIDKVDLLDDNELLDLLIRLVRQDGIMKGRG